MQKRNIGIDLLRIISMFFIVSCHVVSHGGILENSVGLNSDISWIVLMLGIIGLNSYALISGYVGYREEEKPYHYSKILSLWFPVLFYSIVIFIIGGCLNIVTYDGYVLFQSLTPTVQNTYWYFTAYVPVFLAAPFLNRLFRNLSDREMTTLAKVIIGFFSGFATLSGIFGNTMNLNGGMSFVWIFMLYIIGAWIKKCGVGRKISIWKLWVGVLLCIIAGMLILRLTPLGGLVQLYYFVPYTLAAIFMVCIFSRISFTGAGQKIVAVLAPATFGVYLIHAHPVIGAQVIYQAFTGIALESPVVLWPQILGWICLIFFGCLLVECVRIRLFRLCRVDAFIGRLQKKNQ